MDGLKLELDARNEVLKRLKSPLAQLAKADTKELQKRQKRLEAMSCYKTIEEAQESYGYGDITDDEYHAICEAFEAGQRLVDETITPVNLALQILNDFANKMKSEKADLAWEMLPPEEQERIRIAQEQWRATIEAKRGRRNHNENSL